MNKKTLLQFSILAAIVAVMLQAFSNGANFTKDYTGNSGLPSGGSSCGASNCHGGISGADTNRLSIKVLDGANNAITNYAVGATYTVQIKLKINNSLKAGFQAVAFNFMGNAAAGVVNNNLMPTLVNVATYASPALATAQYVSHSLLGTTSPTVIAGGYATWKYSWTAPSTNIGALNIACAGNVTNSSNSNSGDTAFNAVLTLQAPVINTAVAKIQNKITCYPNPCINKMEITSSNTFAKDAKIQIIDWSGKLIKTFVSEANQKNIVLDLSNLNSGLYTLIFGDANSQAISYFTKQ